VEAGNVFVFACKHWAPNGLARTLLLDTSHLMAYVPFLGLKKIVLFRLTVIL
jgi:hypothetical protein